MKTNIPSTVALICSIVLTGVGLPTKGEQGGIRLLNRDGRVVPGARGTSAYPQPHDDYVNDYAGLLTERHAAQIRKRFGKLERKRGIEAVVVTINSIKDYPTGDATIESFATNLFNTWGIGNREKNDGVLILVAVNDRECRIELGAGYGTLYDSAMKSVIDKKMIPCFKKGDYSAGIYKGSCAAIGKLTGKVPWFPILMGLLILVVAFLLVRGLVRAGHRVEVPPAAVPRQAEQAQSPATLAPREVVEAEEVPADATMAEPAPAEEMPPAPMPEETVQVPEMPQRPIQIRMPRLKEPLRGATSLRVAPRETPKKSPARASFSAPSRKAQKAIPRERWWQKDIFGRKTRPAVHGRSAGWRDSGEGGGSFFDILGAVFDILGSVGGGGGGGFGGGSSFGGGASGRW